ncbi:hypothetical protein [Nocardia rhizosphaerae]|uniref:Phage-related protein n=1 Tax=Nocardia rhizosphaerae TaxID=1691571 RepID=A0ABV8L269_9NOCA
MTTPDAPEAIELATAYVSIVGETDKLAASVRNAMRAAQLHADANPINVKADVDVSHIGAIEIPITSDTSAFDREVKQAIRDAQDHAWLNPINLRATVDVSHLGAIELPVTADTTGLAQKINADIATMSIGPIKVDVEPDFSTFPAAMQAQVENLDRLFDLKLKIDVEPDFSNFPAQVNATLASMQALFGWSLPIPVDLDSAAALAQFAALRQALEQMASPIQQNVEIDADRSGLDRVRSALSLDGIAKGSGVASAVAAAIAGITGAAGAALGAVGALGVGLAGLGPVAAAAASTITVGLQGIGDAFTALSAASDSAAGDAEARTKAISAAQDQLKSALDGVEDAQRDLEYAQKDSRDAAEDVAQAYKDAADELDDYQLKLADASLSEKEAELALREAREELAKAAPDKREKALLRLQRAELRYAQAQDRNRDLQEEAAEAFDKGVEGSDRVVEAKDRQAQADQRVAAAERSLTRANEQVAKAQDAVAEAMTKTSAAQDKAAQAFADLAPNAQAFVTATRALAPAWEDLRTAVQDSLFDASAEGITDLAENALPTLKLGMVDVAQSLNALTRSFATFWQAPQNLDAVRNIFAGTADFISGMTAGLHQMTTGFLDFGQAFTPVATKVGEQFGGMLGSIGQAFTDAFQSGALTQLFSTFGDILEGLGGGLNPLIDGLIEMGNVVGPTLGPLFTAIGASIQQMAPSLGAIGATFAKTLTALLPDLATFIDALATGLEPVLPVIGELLSSLMTALTPLIGPLAEIAQIVGNALAQAFTALEPAMGPLAGAFASLVGAVAPILPVIAEVISGLVQALAPALETIFDALGPVIKQFADAMLPVFEELQPILADVAGQIGNALAAALVQIAPHIPDLAQAFGDLVLAIAPMIPDLARIALELLPPFLDVVIAILPQIQKFIEALTWLVKNVIIPYVIPYVQQMTDEIRTGLETVATVITTVREKVGAGIEKMKEFFGDLSNVVSEKWRGIVTTIAKAVKQIGELLEKIPDIPGISSGVADTGKSMVAWAERNGAATGGLLHGPGTGTSDSFLIAASNGEYVINARATAANLPLLEAINSGWTPTAAQMHAMFPGFATGGLVEAQQWARGQAGKPYQYGGVGDPSWDCSGFIGGIWAVLTGKDPRKRYFSTESDFTAFGFEKGLGGDGDFSIGVKRGGGGPNSHMAGTLGDLNVESNGTDGVEVGPSAASAASFPLKWHLPLSGDSGDEGRGLGPNLTGGGSGGNSGGTSGQIRGGRPSKLGQGSTGGSTNGTGEESNGEDAGTTSATDVFVTNWPTSLSLSGEATGVDVTGSDLSTPAVSDTTASSTPYDLSSSTAQSTHPLQGTPLTGDLFTGDAPWYLADSPEQAFANLSTQAATQWESTASDLQGFFSDNWREMVETGAGVLGMGAMGGGGMTVNNYGMSPEGAAAAVERQIRRTNLATMRNGGFGR